MISNSNVLHSSVLASQAPRAPRSEAIFNCGASVCYSRDPSSLSLRGVPELMYCSFSTDTCCAGIKCMIVVYLTLEGHSDVHKKMGSCSELSCILILHLARFGQIADCFVLVTIY